ncbi:hypothetical protein KC19_VG045900 [Ceratodon purpureus]|uniref:Uncharacterized protein n=1 Tax=Ceratodon purpureus TaxID=3225 RepID=A0A8T0HM09_CERPU|nr:hypothetical protein KC19_VG045900 [Ceratodon purpureus]
MVSEQDCRARWERVAAGFCYASEGREESPTMHDRIEELFAITHQRPIGSTKTIGVAFARGILAEKMGFAVNWAEFARKQCQRRHATYEPLRERVTIKHAAEDRPQYWIFDEETKKLEYRLPGCVEDWTLNNKYKDPREHHTVEDFDFCTLFDKYPSQVIGRPVYERLALWQGGKSLDNERGTSSETSGPVISKSLSGAVNQIVPGTGLN